MEFITNIIDDIVYHINHDAGTTIQLVSMLGVIFALSFYEFIIYRLVSRKSMYNKSFHISLIVIPFFIGSIVMALQTNAVVTLGTIGALAIIRYRTAIKDPLDMIFILWSAFIGIMCGCKLYKTCILTSLVVTFVLLLINVFNTNFFNKHLVLVINAERDVEQEINEIISKECKNYSIKSRNYNQNEVNYVYQIKIKNPSNIVKQINEIKAIKNSSIIEYDSDDVI